MKKFLLVILALCLVLGCGPKQDEVERIIEDGAEVVVNHLKPYRLRRRQLRLHLEEELRIDFEKEEFIDLGIKDLRSIVADSEGNIFGIDRYLSAEYLIYKFNRNGRYIKRFGRSGQGPGEVQMLSEITATKDGNIIISDRGNLKLLEFSNDGIFLRETRYPFGIQGLTPLSNGNYLGYRSSGGPSAEEWAMYLCLYGHDFKKIKEIDRYDFKKHYRANKNDGLIATFRWNVTNDKVYVANAQRGYEIRIFDIAGNLLKMIRKDYELVKYPEEFRIQTEEILKYRSDLFVVSHTPPFNSFFVDEEGRIIVMTYEIGEKEGEYIHDIFNSDGVFIGRESIQISGELGRSLNPTLPYSKNNRYYQLKLKDNGYLELVVYRMQWETAK